jgi:hypothetical protein
MSSLTRNEVKALALHRWLAARLVEDPSLVGLAKRRVMRLETSNPAGAAYYREWRALLDGPLEGLLAVLVDPSEHGCALRQESPFVDLVDQKERARVLRAAATAFDAREGL